MHMKKRALYIFLLIIFTSLLIIGCATNAESIMTGMSIDEAIAEAAVQINEWSEAGSKIALINFSSPSDRLSLYVLDELSANLVDSRRLTVVDRAEIDLIRNELDFQYSGEVADNTMQAIGRMLGAQLIVTGSLIEVSRNMFRVSIRVLTVESAAVLVHYRADILNDSRVQFMLGREDASAPVPAPPVPQNLRAGLPETSNVTLSWNNAGSGISYRVYYNTSNTLSGATVYGNTSSTSIDITGLNPGTAYFFWVSSVRSGIESNRSSVVTVTTVISAPVPIVPTPTQPLTTTVTGLIEMVYVPGGSFELGRNLGSGGGWDTTPISTVTMSGFYMGKYPVTQEQYQAIMGSNPSTFNSNPAAGISWYYAIVFCNRLSVNEGLSPAYRINSSTNPDDWGAVPATWDDPLRTTWDAVQIVDGSNGYRLPTEAQWEYAAKGGNGSPGSYTYSGVIMLMMLPGIWETVEAEHMK